MVGISLLLYAMDELKAVKNSWLMWYTLGLLDIKLRYRRSVIGPVWLTISMAVTIFCMGFLYSYLFRIKLDDYFPFLAAGIICWTFISTVIQESSGVIIESSNYIRNQEYSILIFVMRLILRNLTVFFHNFLAFIPVALIFKVGVGLNSLLLLPGLFIIGVNFLFFGAVLSMMGTRYRDIEQIVKSLMQVVFFVTPVMWSPSLLSQKYQWIININPFYHVLSLIKNPMLNQGIHPISLFVVAVTTLLGFLAFALCIRKYKYQLIYWL